VGGGSGTKVCFGAVVGRGGGYLVAGEKGKRSSAGESVRGAGRREGSAGVAGGGYGGLGEKVSPDWEGPKKNWTSQERLLLGPARESNRGTGRLLGRGGGQ